MSRRPDPKARNQLNETAATGRRRAQVQEQSKRQRDAALRSRRLLVELAGAGAGAGGEVSEAALASLGSDVLSERVKVVAATLQRWTDVPAPEWQAALQQLVTLLSTGAYQPVEAALSGGAVAALGALLQLPPSQLPRDAARRAAWALELIANNSPAAAGQVGAAAPVLVGRLAAIAGAAQQAAAAAAAAPSGGGSGVSGEELLEADQLATVLGAIAAWSPELQSTVIACGAPVPLLQLLLATMEAAAQAPAPSRRGQGQQEQQQQSVGELPAAEPPVVRCCTTALWALGMLVRGRPQEVLELVSQAPLPAGLRRILQAASPYPGLLREAAWLLAFATASGGRDAVIMLADLGGMLPSLLLSTVRCVSEAVALNGDDQASHDAAQPLHQALMPLLLSLTNIAAEPSQALLVLAELQASRPLPPLAVTTTDDAMSSADGNGPAAQPVSACLGLGGYASGLQAVLACLENRVAHRGVVRGAAALTAALAWGAAQAGSVAVESVRTALQDWGVVATLVQLLCGAALDIRKEAAAALTSLCQGAAGCGGGALGAAKSSEGGSGPGPGTLDMLRSLGVFSNRDEQGVLAAFLGLLRSPDADAVHAGLRFVTLVLGGVKRGPQLVESLDGIDALEAVQYGTSGCRVPELEAWAEELVDLHYGEGYGDEEEGDDRDDDDDM